MTVDQLGRAYQAYRRAAGSRSMVALLVANAIPLVGVLLFGWSLLTILVIYWLENGIVGFWNVPRILLAQGSVVPVLPPLPEAAARAATGTEDAAKKLQASWERARASQLADADRSPGGGPTASGGGPSAPGDVGSAPGFAHALGAARLPTAGRAGLAAFFLVHYGIFWFVHGVFVFTLPMFLGGAGTSVPCFEPDAFGGLQACPAGAGAFGELLWSNVAIAGIALFLSHGASFLFNYLGNAEYLTASPARQMAAPYGRVVVLHLTILFGAFAVAILGAPIAALLLLVGLKTAFDLTLHRREHRAAANRIPADTTFG